MEVPSLEKLDARVPNWEPEQLIIRNCPFCRMRNEAVLRRPDRLLVAFCESCGCWYVNYLPLLSKIIKQYDGYFNTHRPENLAIQRAIQLKANANKAGQKNWHLQTILKLVADNDHVRVLDVGCGVGDFLLQAKAFGADVVGCDLSPEACEFANSRLGITVYQSELHLCLSQIGSVDVVVMRDFIEHPVDPLINIQAAVGILKKGGLLLIHTPNGGEAGLTAESGKKWVGFRVDLEHLQYISAQTVNWLAEKFNLRIERLEVSGFPNLAGIDKLPTVNGEAEGINAVKKIISALPGVRKLKAVIRRIKNGKEEEFCDPRLGSYHLFTVLRKVQ